MDQLNFTKSNKWDNVNSNTYDERNVKILPDITQEYCINIEDIKLEEDDNYNIDNISEEFETNDTKDTVHHFIKENVKYWNRNGEIVINGALDSFPKMTSSAAIEDVKIEFKEELDFTRNNFTLEGSEDKSLFEDVIVEEIIWCSEDGNYLEKDSILDAVDEVKIEEIQLEGILNDRKFVTLESFDKYKCQVCAFNAHSKEQLEQHANCDHGERKEAFRNEMNQEEALKYLLVSIPSKPKNVPYDVTADDNLKINATGANEQIASLKGINVKNLQCVSCCYTTDRKKDLVVHVNAVHLKYFACYLCKYETARKDNLRQHIATVHNNLKGYHCQMCDFATTKKCLLKYHEGVVHLKLESWQLKSHQCDLCDYKSARKDHLKVHMQNVHNKVKLHQCNVCGYRATHKFTIRQHVSMVHLNVKDYACSICDYKAPRKYNLEQHVKAVHRKLRDFRCSSCDYTASCKGSVTQHKKRVHMCA